MSASKKNKIQSESGRSGGERPLASKEDIAQGYNKVPEEKFMPRKFHQKCVDLLKSQLFKGGKVVDFGCGQGTLLQILSELPMCLELSACDLSPVLAGNTQKRVPDADVRVADIEALPFSNDYFDAAFATEVMEHLATPSKALGEIIHVLKPGGLLLVSLPNRDWFRFQEYVQRRDKFQPVDDHFYSVEEMEGFMHKAGFEIILIRGGENLYFGGGLPHLMEKLALLVYPPLHRRMKRMILLARKPIEDHWLHA